MGAKNHAVILPDADRDNALNGIIGAAFGAAGQRCMAISVVVFVGKANEWLPELEKRVRALKVGNGADAGVDIGPMISKAALDRAVGIIDQSVAAGVTALVDGRGVKVAGSEQGNFLGPTLLTGIKGPGVACYDEEIFGPCLCVVEVSSLTEAIALVNDNPMGNGVALFTKSGGAARKFQHEIEVGQIGINVPVPVPLPFFCWSSSKGSILGDHHFYGKSAVAFHTQIKTVVSRWEFDETKDGSSLNFTGR
jgi:malonate-semialdehyde dehydrogenase (acetylating)/methylmalonate-semialdehyde dehydrogenase